MPPPPTQKKRKKKLLLLLLWLHIAVTLTKIAGPQMWTTPSYKFYIKKKKIYKTCETAEESPFFVSAQLTVGALSPSLNFEFHHLLPNTWHLHGYGSQQKQIPDYCLDSLHPVTKSFIKGQSLATKLVVLYKMST